MKLSLLARDVVIRRASGPGKRRFGCGLWRSRGRLVAVDDQEREELRRLALWLSRRRAVDEALEMLTAYGPAAVERVSTHLDALRVLLAAEQEAFEAVAAAAPAVPQSPLPALLERPRRLDATVHCLGNARQRHLT